MAGRTLGEEIYREVIAKGERSRFAYADVQILKNIETVAELHELCSIVSGNELPGDMSPYAMVEACVVREPNQSEAEAALNSLGPEGGCLYALLIAPFLLLGILIGESLSLIGVDRQQIVHKRVASILVVGVVSAMIGIWQLKAGKDEGVFYLGIVAGVMAGLGIVRERQSMMDICWAVGSFCCPVAFFVACLLIGEQFPLIPAIACVMAIGTGYGMCRSVDDYFMEKKSGKPIKDGMSVLQQSFEAE